MRELKSSAPMLSRAPASIGTAFPRNQEHGTMDKNEFEGKWQQIRGQSKVWWSLITDSDLNKVDKADVKFYEYVTILQLKYRLDRQKAKDEINRHVVEYETNLKINTVITL
jgi:hypothetical protein